MLPKSYYDLLGFLAILPHQPLSQKSSYLLTIDVQSKSKLKSVVECHPVTNAGFRDQPADDGMLKGLKNQYLHVLGTMIVPYRSIKAWPRKQESYHIWILISPE